MPNTNFFTKPVISKNVFFLLLIFLSSINFAQSTYDLSSGSWEDVGIWSSDPGTTVLNDGDCDNGDNFNINGNVVRTGVLYVHGGSAPPPTNAMTNIDINGTLTVVGDMTTDAWAYINVSPEDTLFVDGNLDLIGGAIEVQPSGVVVVTGDCYMDTAGIDVFGDFIVLGDFTMSDAGGSIRNEGNVIIVGDLEITGTSPVIIFGDSDGSDNFFVISDSASINIENPDLTEICSNQDPCVANYGDYDNFLNEDQALVDYVTDLVNGRICSTSITGSITHVTCAGQTDGAIGIVTTGFSTPIYSWRNSSETEIATTRDLADVGAGDYKIVIHQGICIDSSTYTVNDGAADVTTPVFTLGGTSSRCSGKDTLAYVATASNSTGITYELDNASLTAGNSIVDTTGDVAWTASWSGTSVITVSAAGCGGPTTADHTVTIYQSPDVPTVSAQAFCGSATVGDLVSTPGTNGDTVYYYTTTSGGSALSDATALTTGTYYAETVNSSTGCVSASRTSFVVTINILPDVPTVSAQAFCGSATVSDLVSTPGANGDTVYYYTVLSGGSALSDATALTTGTYYAETVNSTTGCVSASRTSFAVTINVLPDAPTVSAQAFCGSATVGDLVSTPGANGDTVYYYTVLSGGSVLSDATALSTGTYYAETVNSSTGCVSASRTSFAVTINVLPAAPTVSAQAFCGSASVGDLVSTPGTNGDTVYYYTVLSGGTALSDATALSTGTYYAETVNSTTGCVSASRTSFAVTINVLPDAPTVSAQAFCGSATVGDLVSTPGANGDTVYYYTTLSGGSALSDATTLSIGTYYAETVNSSTGCVSASRTSFAVTINVLPAAPTVSAHAFCGSAVVADIVSTPGANGDTVYYYTASSGGSALSDATTLSTGTYYAETVNSSTGCVSASRTSFAVTINILPDAPTVSAQAFCGSAAVGDLVSTPGTNGDTVYYYTASSGGSALSDATALTTGTYYAETVNSSTGCVSASRTLFAVTINVLPDAPTVSAQAFCGSATVADLISTSGANGDTVYYYTTLSGGSALSDATALTTGTYYAETVNSSTGCVSASRTSFTVTINVLPAAPTVSAQAFCGSATVGDLVSTPGANGDTVYYYTTLSGGSALSDATALSTGTYYAENVNSSTGCVSTSRTSFAVTINVLPNAPTVSDQAFGGSAVVGELVSTPGANGDTVYYYTTSTGGTALSDGTSLSTGTYYAETVNSTTGCISVGRTSFFVTINTIPGSPIVSDQSFCISATVGDLVSTPGTNGDTVYYYTTSSGGTALSDATALSTGLYYAETGNSATSLVSDSRIGFNVTIYEEPDVPAVSDQSFCEGALVGDLVSTPGTNGDTVYYYTTSSGGTALSDVTSLVAGTYYAETVNSVTGCISSSRTSFVITLNSLPDSPTVSDQSFCESATIGDLISTPGTNGDTVFYYTTTSGGSALSDATALSTGTYYAETINSSTGCISASRSSFAVTINVLPDAPTVSDQAFCGSATVGDLVSTPGANGDTVYYYLSESGGTPLVDATSLVAGIYYAESVNSSTGCVSNSRSSFEVSLESMPGAAGTISGTETVCQGDSTTYVIEAISGASDYTWTYSGSDVAIYPNDTVIALVFGSSATSGELRVYGYSSCGEGSSSGLSITVNASVSDPGDITGETEVCAESTGISYSITALENVESYNWSYSGTGATINENENEITIDFADDATSGELTVYGTNSTCGSGSVSTPLLITVNNIPADAGGINGESSLCAGISAITYNVDSIINATSYTWTYSGSGATIEGTGTSVELSFTSDATSGDLYVYGSNSCGDGTVSDGYSIEIINVPGDAGDITGESTVCQGDVDAVYTVLEIENAETYVWEYSGYGATINNSLYAASIDFDAEATSGDLTVYASNECGAGEASTPLAITVQSEDECAVGQLGVITNAFTPNGDGYHDKWEINNIELYPDASIEVFDRWGRRVFMQDGGYTNSNAWDGTFDGKALPYDNYFYVIDLLGDGSIILRGNLTIIK